MFLLNTSSSLQQSTLRLKKKEVCVVESMKKNIIIQGKSVGKNNIVKILFYNAA